MKDCQTFSNIPAIVEIIVNFENTSKIGLLFLLHFYKLTVITNINGNSKKLISD